MAATLALLPSRALAEPDASPSAVAAADQKEAGSGVDLLAVHAEDKHDLAERVQGPARGIVRLLSRGVDLSDRDSVREGGLSLQLRPRGPGALVRAVFRF